MQRGLLAEFDSPEACAQAIRRLEGRGVDRLEVFMPYPAKEIQEALRQKPSPLPRFVWLAGAAGATIAYLILWWTNAYDYPINVGSHPDHAIPAFIPISFETLVLFAGCTAFLGALWLGGLPRLYHPVDEVEGFPLVTVDRFLLGVDASNYAFDPAQLSSILSSLGALSVRELGDLAQDPEQTAEGGQ